MLHFLLLAHSFTFVLNRYALQCFFDTVKQGKEASLGFQVSEGGDTKIDVTMSDPNGRQILDLKDESIYFHQLTAEIEGDFRYCFVNTKSNDLKTITFNFMTDEDYQTAEEQNLKSGEKLDPVGKEIKKLYQDVHVLKSEQEYLIHREQAHRTTSENTRDRVVWWTLFQVAFVVGVCLFQVNYLKRFFEVKRMV